MTRAQPMPARDAGATDPALPLDATDLQLLAQAGHAGRQLRQEMARVIIGQDQVLQPLLAAVFAQGHTLIVGVPGLAKTLIVRTLARVLGWSFKRIQFTPDMMPSDIIGVELLSDDRDTGTRSMKFVPGPIFANIVLADEINRTPPKTQSALLEAMQEYTVTSMGKTHALDRPFIVFATQNPIEQEGTYPLPEAQLDRFMFSLWIDYPDVEDEETIVASTTASDEPEVREVLSRGQVRAIQELVRRIPASKHVVSYAVALARATRPRDGASAYVKQYVEWGAGPRAGQHMILAAKALAALDGKPAVSAEHVRHVAPFILRHRVLPNYNAVGDGIGAADIVSHVLTEVKEPTYG